MYRRDFITGAVALAAYGQVKDAEALVGTRRALLSRKPLYDPSAIAIFNAFTTPPTSARKTIINNLVVSLKSVGVWTLLDILYLTAAADSQAATINWKSPAGFMLVPVSAPGFVADQGFTGNGTSSRLRTQYTPNANGLNFVQNDASAWVWSRTSAQNANVAIGNITAPRSFVTPRNLSDAILFGINDGTSSTVSNTNGSGLVGTQRPNSATKRAWRNGAQVGADASIASTAIANAEQWVCGGNATNFSTYQIAAAAWGASLSGKEAAFYNAMLTYMQAVGAA